MSVPDEIRRRWFVQRRTLCLIDPLDDDFGSGGLARQAEPLQVRIVVLSADPDDHDVVKLDDDARAWIEQTRLTPWNEGDAVRWGSQTAASSSALRHGDQTSAGWSRFVAVHRHGGVESGFADLAWIAHGRTIFPLRSIVGAMWATLEMQCDAADRWKASGPWQVLLALRSTEGAVLTNFAEGWAEPYHLGRVPSGCTEANVLFQWEVAELDAEAIALDAGARIENAFGTTHRRHLAQRGAYVGQFDPRFQL